MNKIRGTTIEHMYVDEMFQVGDGIDPFAGYATVDERLFRPMIVVRRDDIPMPDFKLSPIDARRPSNQTWKSPWPGKGKRQ